jgi:hypothetical protein
MTAHALFAQNLLHAADRQPFVMQKALDAGQQGHVRRAIIPPPAGALDRLDLRKRLSQKRSTCAGVSSTSATSLIVRKASGDLSIRR